MSSEKPIEPSAEIQFQTEKLTRTIQECNDIETLREIAIELLQLHEKKSAIAQWATIRGAEAECRALIAESDKVGSVCKIFKIIRSDGNSDELAAKIFSSYDEAHIVLERYYTDISGSDEDEREYYEIIEVNRQGA